MTQSDKYSALKNYINRSSARFPYASSAELREIITNESVIYEEYDADNDILYVLVQGSSPIFPCMKFYIFYMKLYLIKRNEYYIGLLEGNQRFELYRVSLEDLSVFGYMPEVYYDKLMKILQSEPSDSYIANGEDENNMSKTNLQAARFQYNFQVAQMWDWRKMNIETGEMI